MADHVEAVATGSRWGGGVAPYAIGSKKLGMWLFIVSDSLTFSVLILVYAYLRLATPDWPTPFPFSPSIIFASVMTFCLLSSSVTMVLAVAAAHRQEHLRTVLWLLATMILGSAFLVLHVTEWSHLIHEGVKPFENPWGTPLFGGTFFGLTGMHMLHVTIGVIYLGIIAFGFGRRKFSSEDVEVSGLYWHFVDLVWMFLFPLIYLMSVKPS
ncbi:cytochrome c oxidase subunit 3 [Acidobacteriia bacterium AH_259_A11_L15]|nr:cytochrome c oxidase subunit 3 [Acidobacteriia bacterium AH_259_A11_L15]